MNFELRPVTEAEFPAFVTAMGDGFGFHPDEDTHADLLSRTDLDRTLAAFDGDELVSTAGAYNFELTVPGGATVRAAGVTFVTVKATHRRRGILTAVMRQQLDDVADRGEPVALLTASESLIYPRFGYGVATLSSNWRLETDHGSLGRPPAPGGRLRLVDASVIKEHGPRLHDERRLRTPGAVTRNEAWWTSWLKDPHHMRNGASKRWYLVHESDDGTIDGFLAYRRRSKYEHGLSRDAAIIDSVFGATDEIEHALIAYLIDKDLIHAVEGTDRPVDDPFRWRLADPRRLQTTEVVDALWARIVDPCRALSARRFATTDRLVLEVEDAFRPATSGSYLADGGPEGAACTRTDAPADLRMSIVELSSIYLGGVRPSELARAGRIVELVPGAAARADAFFLSDPPPWMTTGF